MRYLVLVTLMLLSGCAISPEHFRGPQGNDAYTMRCDGWSRGGMDACYRAASKLCPAGYTILNASSAAVGFNGMIVPRERLTIACKA